MAAATQKIDFRATEEDKELLSKAAKVAGKSLSQFILEISTKEARHILAEDCDITLDSEQWDAFCEQLDNPVTERSNLQKTLQTAPVFVDE